MTLLLRRRATVWWAHTWLSSARTDPQRKSSQGHSTSPHLKRIDKLRWSLYWRQLVQSSTTRVSNRQYWHAIPSKLGSVFALLAWKSNLLQLKWTVGYSTTPMLSTGKKSRRSSRSRRWEKWKRDNSWWHPAIEEILWLGAAIRQMSIKSLHWIIKHLLSTFQSIIIKKNWTEIKWRSCFVFMFFKCVEKFCYKKVYKLGFFLLVLIHQNKMMIGSTEIFYVFFKDLFWLPLESLPVFLIAASLRIELRLKPVFRKATSLAFLSWALWIKGWKVRFIYTSHGLSKTVLASILLSAGNEGHSLVLSRMVSDLLPVGR